MSKLHTKRKLVTFYYYYVHNFNNFSKFDMDNQFSGR
jgi:hypothetical protein